jgi:hypothetical protein
MRTSGSKGSSSDRRANGLSSGWSMFALPPEADVHRRIEYVCLVPIRDIDPLWRQLSIIC